MLILEFADNSFNFWHPNFEIAGLKTFASNWMQTSVKASGFCLQNYGSDIFLESLDNSEQNLHRCIFNFFLKIFWVRPLYNIIFNYFLVRAYTHACNVYLILCEITQELEAKKKNARDFLGQVHKKKVFNKNDMFFISEVHKCSESENL